MTQICVTSAAQLKRGISPPFGCPYFSRRLSLVERAIGCVGALTVSTNFDESLREFLKSILIDVAKEVLPLVIPPGQSGNPAGSGSLRILLRPSEAAEALAISATQLGKLTKDGTVPCVRIGRLVRYDLAALKNWVIRLGSTMENNTPTRIKSVPVVLVPTKSSTGSKERPPAIVRPSMAAASSASPTPPQSSKTKRSEADRDAGNRPRDIRGFIADRLGLDREQLPVLTNGRIMAISGLDIPTLHGWTYLKNRELPEVAIKRLEEFFAAEFQKESTAKRADAFERSVQPPRSVLNADDA